MMDKRIHISRSQRGTAIAVAELAEGFAKVSGEESPTQIEKKRASSPITGADSKSSDNGEESGLIPMTLYTGWEEARLGHFVLYLKYLTKSSLVVF